MAETVLIPQIKELMKGVNLKIKEHNAKAEKAGENFNVFSVMGMEWDEVKTHSAIIGELLDPKGTHGQGSVFLDIFIKQINKKFDIDGEKHINLDAFGKVERRICERTISKEINWEAATGGRIDIIIEDEKQVLIIENKPRAVDQKFQLIRYKKYAESRGKTFYIFYLTMNSKKLEHYECYPIKRKNGEHQKIEGYNFHFTKKSDFDTFEAEHKCLYYPITYRNDIKGWIEECLKETGSLPIINYTLTQYLNLINKLTYQTMNHDLKEDIKSEIKENFIASSAIFENFIETKKSIVKPFLENIISELKTEFSKESEKWDINLYKNHFKDNFTYLLISEKNNRDVYFYFRYTTIAENNKDLPEIISHYGIILDPKFDNKSEVFYSKISNKIVKGNRSILKKRLDNYNLNSISFLNEIAKNKNIYIDKIKDDILSFTNNHLVFYHRLIEICQEENKVSQS